MAALLLSLLFLGALAIFFFTAYRALQISSDDRLVVLRLRDYCESANLLFRSSSVPPAAPELTARLQQMFGEVKQLKTLRGMETLARLPKGLLEGLDRDFSRLKEPEGSFNILVFPPILTAVRTLEGELSDFTIQQSHVLKILESTLLGSLGILGVFLLLDILQDRKRREYRRQVKELLRQSLADLEEERKNLSRELHDTIAQDLAAASILLSASPLSPRDRSPITDSIKRAQSQIRSLAQGLRPPVIDTLGLGEALKQLAGDFQRRSGIRMEYRLPEIGSALIQGQTAIYLYRIVQEALMNTWKHAKARQITLDGALRDGILILKVTDDGQGLSPAAEGQPKTVSLGLLGMRERAHALGATLTLESSPQSGTIITLEVPL